MRNFLDYFKTPGYCYQQIFIILLQESIKVKGGGKSYMWKNYPNVLDKMMDIVKFKVQSPPMLSKEFTPTI